ncbi:MAG TPA: class I SAM-dependent methyltransferase [Candidatus Nitrosopolaris sp.]
MSGLGKRHWDEVIGVLRFIIPVYDRVNRAISLGKDMEYRMKAIHNRLFAGNVVLDAGSGYGHMSRLALQETNGHAHIIMYDPISEMLSKVKEASNNYMDHESLSGVFEYMPFQNDIFDAVMCAYSLRDAINLQSAIAEMHRILKKDGKLIIVDLGKPDNVIFKALISFYIKYVMGVIAFIVAGKAGLKFKTIHGTYIKWPKNSELNLLLRQRFDKVHFSRLMFGGAVIIAAYK